VLRQIGAGVDRSPPTSASVGCRFGQETFDRATCNGQDAPIPVLWTTPRATARVPWHAVRDRSAGPHPPRQCGGTTPLEHDGLGAALALAASNEASSGRCPRAHCSGTEPLRESGEDLIQAPPQELRCEYLVIGQFWPHRKATAVGGPSIGDAVDHYCHGVRADLQLDWFACAEVRRKREG
jgi:hypothetical protein